MTWFRSSCARALLSNSASERTVVIAMNCERDLVIICTGLLLAELEGQYSFPPKDTDVQTLPQQIIFVEMA